MKSVSMFAIVAASIAAGMPAAHAADMSFERALSVDREPQNWALASPELSGHRFSALNEIDTGTVANLRLAFTVGLGGLQAGGRYATAPRSGRRWSTTASCIFPDGWGAFTAIDVAKRPQGRDQVEVRSRRRSRVGRRCRMLRHQQPRRRLVEDKVISVALDGRIFAINRATGELAWERKTAEPALAKR